MSIEMENFKKYLTGEQWILAIKSRFWVKMRADLLELPVKCSTCYDTGVVLDYNSHAIGYCNCTEAIELWNKRST